MRKITAIILVLILGLSLLTSCGGTEEPPPLPAPRTRNSITQTPTPAPDPDPGISSGSPEGFYTIVSLGDDADEFLDLYRSLGMDLNNFYIQLLAGGVFKMGVFPDDEDDISEGTYVIDGTTITLQSDGEYLSGTFEDNRISLNEDGIEMVFERNDSFRGPTFDGTDTDDQELIIPGAGGSFNVRGNTMFSFIPNQTGVWEIRTLDSGSGDPYLELYDQFGFDIWEDDDGGGDNDARIIYVLKAGTEYKIRARFWSSSYEGSFTLRVSHVNPPVIPVGGGSAVVTEDTIFSFIPNASGSWEFKTSDNGRSDPVVELLDENGDWIMGDDDSGGDRNALFTATVNEGTQYYISARFWFGGDGEFTLNVTAP